MTLNSGTNAFCRWALDEHGLEGWMVVGSQVSHKGCTRFLGSEWQCVQQFLQR